MATQPDIITPQLPPETLVPTDPAEAPNSDLPGIGEPAPDYDKGNSGDAGPLTLGNMHRDAHPFTVELLPGNYQTLFRKRNHDLV